MASRDTILPEVRTPKSPKRFFAALTTPKSAPSVPSLPAFIAPPAPQSHSSQSSVSSSASAPGLGLGSGAQVVRTPSDALRGVRSATSGNHWINVNPSPSMEELWQPSTAPLPPAIKNKTSHDAFWSTPRVEVLPRRSQTQTKTKAKATTRPTDQLGGSLSGPDRFKSKTMSHGPRLDPVHISTFDPFQLGSTDDPPPRPSRSSKRLTSKPSIPDGLGDPPPFSAVLLSKTTSRCPTSKSTTLVTLDFAYSLDSPPDRSSVVLPLPVIQQGGGYLAEWVETHLKDDEDGLEMTDGSSADETDLESDNGLDALLRDEYLQSILIASPTESFDPVPLYSTPLPPLPMLSKVKLNPTCPPQKRGATRNQYVQRQPFPTPLSSMTNEALPPLRGTCALTIEADGGGVITNLKVLLLRDAGCYHMIAARLLRGCWPALSGVSRRKVEAECRWLGMGRLERELERFKGKSMVLEGGRGYI